MTGRENKSNLPVPPLLIVLSSFSSVSSIWSSSRLLSQSQQCLRGLVGYEMQQP